MASAVNSRKDDAQRDPALRDAVIQHGDYVLVQIANGDIRSVKVDKNTTVNINKFGSFYANDLIGHPYGITYQIEGKRLKSMPPPTLQEVEDTNATNEYINDGGFVQPLTVQELQALRQAGVPPSDIIQKQIEQHSNYSLKTEYSKEKYRKRKEAKYFKAFATLEPSLYNVCEYWFAKDQARLRDIRIDTLSQILNLANVRPGGRYLIVDDASGVVVAAVLERLGGKGCLTTIHDAESPPPYPVMANMNFSSEYTSIMSSLNWATADESHNPVLPPTEVQPREAKSERQKSRLNKRKAMSDHLYNTREELFKGEFDGLILATQYDPYSIIEKYGQYLAGSGNLVVHSPYPQVVAELQAKLRNIPEWLSPNVTESWLRRYQILPGRTHPLMNMSGSGGFLLHAIRVYDDPAATYTKLYEHRSKKPRSDTERSGSVVETITRETSSSFAQVSETNIESKVEVELKTEVQMGEEV